MTRKAACASRRRIGPCSSPQFGRAEGEEFMPLDRHGGPCEPLQHSHQPTKPRLDAPASDARCIMRRSRPHHPRLPDVHARAERAHGQPCP
jgi:hypothetical protein